MRRVRSGEFVVRLSLIESFVGKSYSPDAPIQRCNACHAICRRFYRYLLLHRDARNRRPDTAVWKFGFVRTAPIRDGCDNILAAEQLHCFFIFFPLNITHAMTNGFGTVRLWIGRSLARVGFCQSFFTQNLAPGGVPRGFERLLPVFHFATQICLIRAFT